MTLQPIPYVPRVTQGSQEVPTVCNVGQYCYGAPYAVVQFEIKVAGPVFVGPVMVTLPVAFTDLELIALHVYDASMDGFWRAHAGVIAPYLLEIEALPYAVLAVGDLIMGYIVGVPE